VRIEEDGKLSIQWCDVVHMHGHKKEKVMTDDLTPEAQIAAKYAVMAGYDVQFSCPGYTRKLESADEKGKAR